MNVLGVDPSLTCTGVAGDNFVATIVPGNRTGASRLIWIRHALSVYVGEHRPELVVMEAPAFSAKGRAVVDLGGLHWTLRLWLYEHRQPFAVVPPTCLKKFATGRGNASKEEVLTAAVRRLGYEESSTDEADALWLHQMGLHHLGHPLALDLPKVHLASLEGVDWPPPVASVKKVIRRSS